MSAKHTPGPWRTFVEGELRHKDMEDGPGIFSGHYLIARTVGYTVHGEELLANARLIAAAPDLLEALSRAHLVTCPTVDPIHHTCGGCSVSAVIEKAEGK